MAEFLNTARFASTEDRDIYELAKLVGDHGGDPTSPTGDFWLYVNPDGEVFVIVEDIHTVVEVWFYRSLKDGQDRYDTLLAKHAEWEAARAARTGELPVYTEAQPAIGQATVTEMEA